MSWWLIREMKRTEGHSTVAVFVGPSDEHRAKAGELVFAPDELDEFVAMLSIEGWNRLEVELLNAR